LTVGDEARFVAFHTAATGDAQQERRDNVNAIKQLLARLRAALKPRG
jgi:hypothetical protein